MAQPALQQLDATDKALQRALSRAAEHLCNLQQPDGSWRGDYGGPMFLLPMYVAACYMGQRTIPLPRRQRMISYFANVQNADGSIGLHAEDVQGCMFTSVLCYVALRLLGVSPEEEAPRRMRAWIVRNGGALGSASWGKFMLAVLNLYPYEGLHPITPELWLLPRAAPLHPGRWWCHARQVYLPMAYLYGLRAAAPLDGLLSDLREEIYAQPYASIRFAEHRDTLYEGDQRVESSWVLELANRLTALYERHHAQGLRARALAELLEHIDYEDRSTHFIRIGPVNAVLNTLVQLFARPGSEEVTRSFAALEDYLCDGHDGTKMNGYNSTALWDTAFAVQALLASPQAENDAAVLERAYGYVRENQVLEELPQAERYFRHRCYGGWPFSNRAHGWPITDCTAEGLKVALALEPRVAAPIPEERLRASVELLLSFQNKDGSWSSYERQRAGRWLERFNPSQVFAGIMVDYGYVECTSAVIQALVHARARFPEFEPQIRPAVRRGERFLRRQQRPDGSFIGSWAVCFTYGTWFGVNGLLAAGASLSDPAVQRACRFLERQQAPDGSFGEHYRSCSEGRYVRHLRGQVVNTAWALLTLVQAGRAQSPAAAAAARFLVERQQPDGDWPREAIVGVFNKTALINYENYRRYFPLWALGLYAQALERRVV